MPISLPAGNYYPTQEAATATGLSEGRIRQMILRNEIIAIPAGGKGYLIPEAEIVRINSTVRKPGRRPKSAPANGLA